MKKLFFLFLLFVFISACRSTRHASDLAQRAEDPGTNAQYTDHDEEYDYYQPTSWLLGYFNPALMKQSPHSSWFDKGYAEYTPGSDALNRLLEIPDDDLTIKIVMGSWCSDSRREVPRFMKILDLMQFPEERITFIGVDVDKRSPVGDYENLAIERVPTFIFYENNIETGRIIEVPESSLEQDMVKILQE